MYQRINEDDFVTAFKVYNREKNFSHSGLSALFDYFERLEDNIPDKIELDVIDICCNYTEYANLAEFQEAYSTDFETIEDIEDVTTIIPIEGTDRFIVQNF